MSRVVNVLFDNMAEPTVIQIDRKVYVYGAFDPNHSTLEFGVSEACNSGSWGYQSKKICHDNTPEVEPGRFIVELEDLSGRGMFPDGEPNKKKVYLANTEELIAFLRSKECMHTLSTPTRNPLSPEAIFVICEDEKVPQTTSDLCDYWQIQAFNAFNGLMSSEFCEKCHRPEEECPACGRHVCGCYQFEKERKYCKCGCY